MAQICSDWTDEQILAYLTNKTKPQLEVSSASRTGGLLIDTDGNQVKMKVHNFVPSYKRRDRSQWEQKSYASKLQLAEDQKLMDDQALSMCDKSSVTLGSRLEKLEIDSTISGVSTLQLPEGVTEEQANMVYQKYNFGSRTKYDKKLSITPYADEIISNIESNQVLVIQGETGSGKTTQVPQYILDHYAYKNKYCNIVVTQPRRIAAQSIAMRVCYERGWDLGRVCGYQIGMDRMASADTRLLYCTTQVLLEKMINQKNMQMFTHIILDEVHERDQYSDFLLLIVRKLLRTNSRDTKVVLMSATLESQQFARYFSVPVRGRLEPAPVLNVEGRTFKVAEFYLDDLTSLGQLGMAEKPEITSQHMEIAAKLVEQFDNIEAQQTVYAKEAGRHLRGSVLMFLPGLAEIQQMMRILQRQNAERGLHLFLVPLHSTLSGEEQRKVFQRPEPSQRKVVMATNIAESSITVPDIKYVIDFCLTKNQQVDPGTNYSSLQVQWASKSNCIQRKGRAGRVSDGRVYRLVHRKFYQNPEPICPHGSPEMERVPLHQVVLKAKSFDMGSPREILGMALSPPDESDIERTVLQLKEVGALTTFEGPRSDPFDGNLTFLGRVLATLPVDVHLGKLMLLGYAFGLLDETIIIAASLSLKSFFLRPFDPAEQLQSFKKKFEWAQGSFSDLIACLNAYKVWKSQKMTGQFSASAFSERQFGTQAKLQVRRLQEVDILVDELTKRLRGMNILSPHLPEGRVKRNPDEEELLLKMIFCGAFYPNFFIHSPVNEVEANRVMGGFNPFTTVVVRGVPPKQGHIYRKEIQSIFKVCDPRNQMPKVYPEETRAFIEFNRDYSTQPAMHVLPAVHLALKMRSLQVGMSIQLLPEDEAMRRSEQIQLEHTESRSTSHLNRIYTHDMNFVEPPPPNMSVIRLFITEVDSANHFWGHYGDYETHKLMGQLLDTINSKQLTSLPSGDIKVGTLCLAPYKDDSESFFKFYRARVEKVERAVQGEVKVEVFFVDYGNHATVKVEELRVMEAELRENLFQTMEFELAHIKPSPVLCPNGRWSKDAQQALYNMVAANGNLVAEIFSTVHGVCRVELYDHKDREQVHINKKLIEMGFGDVAEEPYVSKQNNEERLREQMNYDRGQGMTKANTGELSDRLQLPSFADFAETSKKSQFSSWCKLQGPYHGFEMGFASMTSTGNRVVRIERESINDIVVDEEPQSSFQRLLVAAFVGLNPAGSAMLIRDTTLMPNLPGIPQLAALLFCPLAELRTDPDMKAYTGALCGLGCEEDSYEPLLPEHDMEVAFDTVFDDEDLQLVNNVRMAIGLAVGTDSTRNDWGPDLILRVQDRARKKLLELLTRKRKTREVKHFKRSHFWNQIDPTLLLHPDVEDLEANVMLYKLHSGIDLYGNDDVAEEEEEWDLNTRKRMHNKWLHERASRSTEQIVTRCLLCKVEAKSPFELQLHLASMMHKQQEISIITLVKQ